MPTTQVSIGPPCEVSSIRARAEAILWINSATTCHGISLQQLELPGCFVSVKSEAMPKMSAKYIDAAGNLWDGTGSVSE